MYHPPAPASCEPDSRRGRGRNHSSSKTLNRGGVSVRAARWTTERCSAPAVWEEREARLAAAPRRGRVSGGVAAPEPVDRAAHCRLVRGRLERPEGALELRGIRDEGPFELVQGLVQLS